MVFRKISLTLLQFELTAEAIWHPPSAKYVAGRIPGAPLFCSCCFPDLVVQNVSSPILTLWKEPLHRSKGHISRLVAILILK